MTNKQIEFNITQLDHYVLLSFELLTKGGIIDPVILSALKPPEPIEHNFAHKGVIISGKGPIWLYGFLIHFYHPTKWVATFDPRLQGGVVVESHSADMEVGTIVILNPSLLNLKKQ